MDAPELEFDAPAYQRINIAREKWLRCIVAQIPFRRELRTALDAGCGAGYFSNVLEHLGLSVTGIDLREENLSVCRQRCPRARFARVNLDGSFQLPRFDLVLMFGILYHLQSPLLTIQQLSRSIGRVGIISTRIAAGADAELRLFRENRGPAHNCAAITAVPTLPALTAIFANAGLSFLWLPDSQPQHSEWRTGGNGQRVSFVATREPISVPGWRRLPVGRVPQKWGARRFAQRVVSYFRRR